MTTEVHGADELPEPVRELLDAAHRVTPGWLHGAVAAAARRHGVELRPDELAACAEQSTDRLLADLATLLATDVDEQRQNPLALFRAAVAGPTELLLAAGARPGRGDRFAAEHFPDDPFGLGPATWSDVHPDLHVPGLTWGAWKAMTVLQRRRDEGLR